MIQHCIPRLKNLTHSWCWHNATSVATLKLILETRTPHIDHQRMENGSYIQQFLLLLSTCQYVVNPHDLITSLMRDHLPDDLTILDEYQPVHNTFLIIYFFKIISNMYIYAG